MDLKGNIFFNVTLSFWTNATSPGGDNIHESSAESTVVSSLPLKPAINYGQGNAISGNSSLGNNNETTISDVSKSALFKVKLLINEGTSNNSSIDRDDSADIINRHEHLFDSLNSRRAGNRSWSDHSSIADSLASLVSHYEDASLAHQENLPSLTAITNSTDSLLSSTSPSLTSWNSTFASGAASNWTNLTYSIGCMDGTADNCLRATNLTGDIGMLDQHDRVYWALFLVILPVLALFGNVLVILSVYRERSLQTVTNWFIVSLAVADSAVTVPMLFSLYVMVNVDWELSELICDLYIAIDVICSTASIFNLVAISFDRYIAVTHPIFYTRHCKSDKRVAVTIILVWMASLGVGLPIMLGANTSSERTPELCIFYNSDFIIYSSLWSFYVPCLIMVILYYKIFKAIHDRARKKINSTKSKANSNNASLSKNNIAGKGTDGHNHMQTYENVSLNKQTQVKIGNSIKLEQIKAPIEGRNHIQTSVALISEINIVTAENNNSNNTESHLEDEEEEDEEDLEDGEEIEIKQLNNRRSSQFNSDATCNCSIYANASDKLNANAQGDAVLSKAPNCQHRSCQEARQDAVVDIEPDGGHLVGPATMFIVENASATLHHLSANNNNMSCPSVGIGGEFNQSPQQLQQQPTVTDETRNGAEARESGSPSASTSATGRESEHRLARVVDGSCKNGTTNCRPNCVQLNHAATKEPPEEAAINDNGSNGHNESDLVTKHSKKKSRFNLGRKHKSSRKKREKASAKRERKATKTLAIVLGVFLLCWTPFFSCNILDAICIKLHDNGFIQSDCRPGMTAFLLTTWLGYMNSCANPLIYTIFNPEFRKAFRKILCQL